MWIQAGSEGSGGSAAESGRRSGTASGPSGHSGKRRRRWLVPWGALPGTPVYHGGRKGAAVFGDGLEEPDRPWEPAQDCIKNLWAAFGRRGGEKRTFFGVGAVSDRKEGPMPPAPGRLMGTWEQRKESKMLKVISPSCGYNLHQNTGRSGGPAACSEANQRNRKEGLQ